MSEQYRCTSCGYVLDMSEMQCAECNLAGKFERVDVESERRIAQLEEAVAFLKDLLALANYKIDTLTRKR